MVYKIMRIYEVPAENQTQASVRMMEALTLRVEKDFHVMDYIKSPDDPKGKGKKVSLDPPKGWGVVFMQKVFGDLAKSRG